MAQVLFHLVLHINNFQHENIYIVKEKSQNEIFIRLFAWTLKNVLKYIHSHYINSQKTNHITRTLYRLN